MINEVIVVGRIVGEYGYIKKNNKKYLHIVLEVEKAFRNPKGSYDKDSIDCLLWQGEAERLLDCIGTCHWLSIKGRLERNDEKYMFVMAEKVKFIDSMFSS